MATPKIDVKVKSKEMQHKISEFACEAIEMFELKKDEKPTREDMRDLLETEKGNLFYFNVSFQSISDEDYQSLNPSSALSKKSKSHKDVEYKEINKTFRERYRLYKIKSDKGPYSLTPQTYIGLIKDGDDEAKTKKLSSLIKDAKHYIVKRKRMYRAAQVHTIASLAIIYDLDDIEDPVPLPLPSFPPPPHCPLDTKSFMDGEAEDGAGDAQCIDDEVPINQDQSCDESPSKRFKEDDESNNKE